MRQENAQRRVVISRSQVQQPRSGVLLFPCEAVGCAGRRRRRCRLGQQVAVGFVGRHRFHGAAGHLCADAAQAVDQEDAGVGLSVGLLAEQVQAKQVVGGGGAVAGHQRLGEAQIVVAVARRDGPAAAVVNLPHAVAITIVDVVGNRVVYAPAHANRVVGEQVALVINVHLFAGVARIHARR